MTSRTRRRQSITEYRPSPGAVRGPRARRGAIVVLVAILLVAMVGMFALAVDFGRLDTLRADLQKSADAAALAGAVELIPVVPHIPADAEIVATTWVAKNSAMHSPITVLDAQCGSWTDVGPVFLNTSCADPTANSIFVTVSRQSSGLFMTALGVSPPILTAKSAAAVRPDLLLSPPYSVCLPANCRVYLVTLPP